MPEKSATTNLFQVTINSTIDKVWHEITKTDEPIPAFFNTQMHRGPLKPVSLGWAGTVW